MHLKILQVQELQMMRVFKVSDGTNDQFEKTSFSFLFLLLLVIEVLFTEILSNVLSDLTCMEWDDIQSASPGKQCEIVNNWSKQ